MKQRKMDYHLHTIHSPDGEQTMWELCENMVQRGVEEICITDHIDPGHPEPGMDRFPVWAEWYRDAEECRSAFPQLQLRLGLEIGDLPQEREKIRKLLSELSLDFWLLSLHVVEGMDPYDPPYFQNRSRNEAYKAYARAKMESVCAWTEFDSVAHIGYVAKRAPYPIKNRAFRYEDAPEEMDALLKHVIRLEKCIEVNTAGYAATGDVQPHSSILKRYIDLGGEIFTFGSDSHSVSRNYDQIERAKEQVRQLGGKYQAAFRNHQRTLYKL